MFTALNFGFYLSKCERQGTGMSMRLDWTFHISEGTVFKLIPLSFAYLHFLFLFLFLIFICKRKQKENSGWSYVGLKIDLSRLSTRSYGLLARGRHLKREGIYFQILLLYRTEMIASSNFTIDSINFFGLLWPFCNLVKSGQVLFLHAWFDGRMADKLNNHIWASGIHNWPITYGILLHIITW
jgi:hypothetical protein